MIKKSVYQLLFGLAVVALVASVAFVISDYFITRERLPYNTFIENVNVSLLTQSEAIQKISELPPEQLISSPFIAYYADRDFFLPPQALGIEVDIKKSVENAFHQTHRHNYLRELRHRMANEALVFPVKVNIDEEKMKNAIASLAQKINCASQDATVEILGKGAYHIVPERPSRTLLVSESVEKVKNALEQGEHLLPLQVMEIAPRIKYIDLAVFPPVHLLSQFTTYYGSHDSKNRIHNIQLIANTMITGAVLLSGETFSLIEKIGSISPERGFKEAFVITEGELEPQVGGGTCQTATTLFNAALLADLEIISRRNHSLYFYIYPLGRDATVYNKNLDFKFSNNTGHPILIKAKATRRSLTFSIYGTPTGKSVSFSSPTVIYQDETGQKKVGWKPPKDLPFSTRVTRFVKKEGKIIKQEMIRSYYKLLGDGTNVVIRRPEPR